jgi:hypothetical protein
VTTQEYFTLLYLLDLYTVQRKLPEKLPDGIFPPGVHQCYQAAGIPVPVSLQPPTVAHVPLEQQNPVENLALQAESTRRSCQALLTLTYLCIRSNLCLTKIPGHFPRVSQRESFDTFLESSQRLLSISFFSHL